MGDQGRAREAAVEKAADEFVTMFDAVWDAAAKFYKKRIEELEDDLDAERKARAFDLRMRQENEIEPQGY